MAERSDYLKSLLWAFAHEIGKKNDSFKSNFTDLIQFVNERFHLNVQDSDVDYKALSDSYSNTFDNSIDGEIFMQNGRYENEFFVNNKEIGFGAFGGVYKVKSKFDDHIYAVKRQSFHKTHTKGMHKKLIIIQDINVI